MSKDNKEWQKDSVLLHTNCSSCEKCGGKSHTTLDTNHIQKGMCCRLLKNTTRCNSCGDTKTHYASSGTS